MSPGAITWIGDSNRFWYPRTVKGGTEYLLVDAALGERKFAFDHDRLARAISAATGQRFTGLTLPFMGRPSPTTSPLQFYDGERQIQFGIGGFLYQCNVKDYTCTKGDAITQRTADVPARGVNPEGPGGDPVDGLEYQPPAPQQGDASGGRTPVRLQRPCAPRPQNPVRNQRPASRVGVGALFPGQLPPEPPEVCASFDGKWEVLIRNFNLFLKPVGNAPAVPLSYDGSEGNYYTLQSVAWSPDSTKLAAYHTRPGYDRQVHYIESSPADQVQPKHSTMSYRKPGDALDIAYPALFDIARKKETEIDRALFPNPYSISAPVWWKDSRGFTFEYNQRGHQVYRVIEVDAQTGKARALITEESKTFIYYNLLGSGLSAGRRYRHDLNDGKEIVWASERDGWEHLYLYDGITGKLKKQITKGNWLVRNVDFVDEDKRQIWFDAGGMKPDQDPYFTQSYRINFDGTGLTPLTDANGAHTIILSPDHSYYVDTWQRVDLPPVAQLRRASDQKVVMDLDRGDASAFLSAGFRLPEVFVAKGRDGEDRYLGSHLPA